MVTSNTYGHLVSESTAHGMSLRLLLESRMTENDILSDNKEIHKLVHERSRYTDASELTRSAYHERFLEQIRMFEEERGYSMAISDVSILDVNADTVFVLHDYNEEYASDSTYFERMEDGKSFAVFEPGRDGPSLVVVSAIKLDSGEQIGIIVSRTSAAMINDILLARSGLGPNGEVYIVDHDGRMVSPSKFAENSIFNTVIESDAVSACFENGQRNTEIYKNYLDREVYASSYCMRDLGFVLMAETDRDKVESHLVEWQNNMVQAGAIIMAGMGALAVLVARTISKPICRLKTVAGEIADGNFDVKSEVKAGGEIGDLAGEFDVMADRLKESMSRIREKEGVIRQQEGALLQFSSHSEKYCVGMIDIMNSTKTCANMSDAQMSDYYRIFINSMGLIVQKYEGVVVKNIGDALLFYFSIYGHDEKQILKKCIDCCINMCEIHDRVARRLKRADLPKMNYRISATYGIVRIAKSSTSLVEDIFGTTVNMCSKINRSAPENGVVIGEYFYESAKDIEEFEFEKIEKDAVLSDHGYTCYTVKKKMMVKVPPVAVASAAKSTAAQV